MFRHIGDPMIAAGLAVGLAILAINVAAFALSLVWPDWDAMGMGHEMVVRKP